MGYKNGLGENSGTVPNVPFRRPARSACPKNSKPTKSYLIHQFDTFFGVFNRKFTHDQHVSGMYSGGPPKAPGIQGRHPVPVGRPAHPDRNRRRPGGFPVEKGPFRGLNSVTRVGSGGSELNRYFFLQLPHRLAARRLGFGKSVELVKQTLFQSKNAFRDQLSWIETD